MLINKDTKLYGSFSLEPGNNGCIFFNEQFEKDGINAIYKSYYSNDIKKSVEAARNLGFSGFAVSAPFKKDVLKCVEGIETPVNLIGAANTIVNIDGCFVAHNTDWLGVYNFFKTYWWTGWYNKSRKITILGDGGFSKAVQYAFYCLDIPYQVITRKEWYKIPNIEGVIFNATPEEVEINNDIDKAILIDGRPFTENGKKIARLQAIEQYKIYMKYANA